LHTAVIQNIIIENIDAHFTKLIYNYPAIHYPYHQDKS
jgi:hypothetical protein